MDFKFTKEQESFRQEIRGFVKEHLPPGHIGGIFAEETDQEAWDLAMATSKKLAKKKWLTLSWPEEHGGLGASFWDRIVMSEEISYWGIPGTGMGVSGTKWVGPSLMLFGTDEQKKKHIPPIAQGDEEGIWCTGYSEPDAGTDLASLQTQAIKVGDEYILNGQKVWTSCAHHAKWLWVICRTDPNAGKKHQGLSLFLVDMESEGLTVRPLKNFVGHHVFNELFFNDVKVPAANLVGTENNGWAHLMTALSFERGVGLGQVASCRRLFDELIHYTKETGLIDKPEIRQKLADLAVDIEAARMLTYEWAWKSAQGATVIHEPSRDKANCDVMMEKLSRVGTEILGVYSQIDVTDKDNRWTKLRGSFEHLYYYCIGMAIAAGTTDTQRNIVGQFGLQLPRAY